MERELVHGEGDLEGEPFTLAPHMLRALYRWFEYDPDTRLYFHNKGLLGWPKGSVKSEFASALGLEHMEGPSWTPGSPVVTVAAVDGDQADELVRIAGMMVRDRPVGDRLEVNNGRILQRGGGGRMLATSSALGKNDGKRTSLLLADEIHEWDGIAAAPGGAKRHGILERNTNKRRNGRQLNITTAGFSLESLAGAMYSYGLQVSSDPPEVHDPAFLFDWYEASHQWDLEDPEQLVCAIIEANPMAAVVPDLVDRLVRSYREHKLRGEEQDFLRYHLNRWVGVLEDAFLPDIALWRARVGEGVPKDGTAVVLGFDGSRNGDSTALMGATVGHVPHWFVIGHWERQQGQREWEVPIEEVEAAIILAHRRWKVAHMVADFSYWHRTLSPLAQKLGTIEEIPQSGKRLSAASMRGYEAITRGQMTHADHSALNRHMANCRRQDTEWGFRVVKEHSRSLRFIDLAVAGLFAHEQASQLAFQERPPQPAIHVYPD